MFPNFASLPKKIEWLLILKLDIVTQIQFSGEKFVIGKSFEPKFWRTEYFMQPVYVTMLWMTSNGKLFDL